MKLFSNALNFMNIALPDTRPGNVGQKALQIGDVKLATSICYEIGFPELIRFKDETIGMILTVINDAWFGKSNARAQHLQMAKMRAIELGRPVMTVTNDGITALINPQGNIAAEAPEHEIFVLTTHIQPMHGMTPWMKNGMDPLLFILICMIVSAVLKKRKAIRLANESQNVSLTTQ